MKIKHLHDWNFTVAGAVDLQRRLARKLKFRPISKPPMFIAGIDCAFTDDRKRIIAAAVVMRKKSCDFELVESRFAVRRLTFPYVPGLLSFRELPVCLDALEQIVSPVDCVLVDGQGYAHPRRFGIACHLGLFVNVATIGCAKSRLIGEHGELKITKGSCAGLVHNNELIGSAVRSRTDTKPLYISIGNRCNLQDAIRIVLECCTKYRLPEPTRLAHQTVSKLKAGVPL